MLRLPAVWKQFGRVFLHFMEIHQNLPRENDGNT